MAHSLQPPPPRKASKGQGHFQPKSVRTTQDRWRQHIEDIYPERHQKTYFLPPLPFSRRAVPEYTSCEGETVLVVGQSLPCDPQPSQRGRRRTGDGAATDARACAKPVASSVFTTNPDPASMKPVHASDIQEDLAQQRVLEYLEDLSKEQEEAMMVISRLDFMKYLTSDTQPLDSASSSLPTARNVHADLRRGDFDLLIINRNRGLLTGEIKSIKRAENQNWEDFLKTVVKRVDKSVKQLNKAESVLKTFVSDLDRDMFVSKALILPSVTAEQLKQALESDGTSSQRLCQCLKTRDINQAVSHCLLADDFSSPRRQSQPLLHREGEGRAVAGRGVGELARWWNKVYPPRGAPMTEDLYDILLSRFCGPATEVEIPTVTAPYKCIRSLGQYVAETGLQFSVLALHPSQLAILKHGASRLFLCGPPGTGKTVLLTLKAKQWVLQGKTVHVVSTHYKSRAVSILTVRQVQELCNPAGVGVGQVKLDVYNFDNSDTDDVTKAVHHLSSCAVDGELYVIVDEVGSMYRDRFREFCNSLLDRVPSLCVWAANLNSENIPQCLQAQPMTTMLRCPPVIHRQVQKSNLIALNNQSYDSIGAHAPTDGPPIQWLRHRGLRNHTEEGIRNCVQCGRQIAQTLQALRIRDSGLQYRDVLIIYYNPQDEDQVASSSESDSEPPSSPPGLVLGLKEHDIPVTVLRRHDTEDVYCDVALAMSNKVVVSHWENVAGLERRVVIGMGDVTDMDRFYVMSRCTSQLLWIEAREPGAGT